jgi:aryl-alcohol dehydrogenase-like predicted oxidoreductase
MYVDAGGMFIDTANVYARWIEGAQGGESEALLGRWMQSRGHRSKLFIATKIGAPYGDVPASLKARYVEQEVEKSLKRLGIDTIDLYYAHRDDRETPQEEHLAAMDKLVRAGKVRYIGASNWLAWRLEGAWKLSDANGWAHHVAVQEKHSYLIPRAGWKPDGHPYASGEFLEYCGLRDIAVVAYSPLVKGAYTRADKTLPAAYTGPDNEARLAALKKVAAETGATPNQIVLAWLMQQASPRVIPLFSASTPDQMQENLGAVDLELSAEHMQHLSEAGLG